MKKKYSDNTSLEKKLKAYSLAAVSVLAVQPAAGAIVYTNIPDTTFTTTGEILLDINNDATDDFSLQFTAGTESKSVRISPNVGNEVLGSVSAGNAFFYPFALNLNAPIGSTQTVWNGTINGGYLTMAWLYTTGATYGNWFGMTDKYLGIRFKVGTNWHYGWVRLDVPANVGSMTVKDFAFDNVANTAIAAGATGLAGIKPSLLPDGIQLFASNRILSIDLHDVDLNEASISLVSVNGQMVINEKINGSKTEIGLAMLNRGIYLATITSREGVLTKRIYVE